MNRDLLQTYLDYQQPLGTTVRHGTCPFCGPVGRKGFVVTRKPTGFICWCHRCHKSYGVKSGTPSRTQCLRIADGQMHKIQNLRKCGLSGLRRQAIDVEEKKAFISLPFDVTKVIPMNALLWLAKYHVTSEEIKRYNISYSPYFERLILPVYDRHGRLVYWQGRYFGKDSSGTHPKYYNTRSSRGEIWFDTGGDSNIIVVVEDILSALSVARAGYRAFALLGSYVSDNLIRKLQSEGKQVCVWLDLDKQCASMQYTKRLNVFGVQAKTIVTTEDPKEYLPDRIIKEVEHAYPRTDQISAGVGSDTRADEPATTSNSSDLFEEFAPKETPSETVESTSYRPWHNQQTYP